MDLKLISRRFSLVSSLALLLSLWFLVWDASAGWSAESTYLVGVARIDVTPSEPIRLAGYGARRTESTGVAQKLWAKALALGTDAEGPALLLTLDNCGIAEPTYLELTRRLLEKAGLPRERIAICISHTHTGPCTTAWAPNIFGKDITPEEQATIDRYTRELLDKMERVALTALKDRRPAHLSWAQGAVDFAANRRTTGGPVDHSLPVLRVTDLEGNLRALVANYACHCTTLGGDFNRVHADWAGCAREDLERDHPGAVAFITIGCGADSNPQPRGGADGGLALAQQHGESLAAEVARLLHYNFKPLSERLSARLKHIELPFSPQFTRAQWEERARQSGIVGYHARKNLARLDRGETLPDTLSYYVQTWTFGDELGLVFLSGEVVVDYDLRLKAELDASRLWISAYANYVPCYIPSRRILEEGGYEAESSLWYYDRPQRLAPATEDLIVHTVHELLPASYQFDKQQAEHPDPKSPAQALATFRTKAELDIEQVAAEPLIQSPVAIDWGADGRLWVCEMYDYPSGLDGNWKPGGRIKVLSDSDGDGRYDQGVVFLDGLPFPTGVMPWRKGALICAAPDILYAEDTDGDGRADLVETNFTGFATHNYQARVNGFRWGLDGWLYGSSGLFGGKITSRLTGREVDLSGRDFRFHPETGEIEPVSSISQMGRIRDDFGNWFGNDNSTLLWSYPVGDHYLRRNPYVTSPAPRVSVAAPGSRAAKWIAEHGDQSYAGRLAVTDTDPNRLYPSSRTLERFNDPQAANRITSGCGPEIYRDDLLGPEYEGNAFVCAPVHNLVRRLVLLPDGASFEGFRAADEADAEFLASSDNWFRPVQVRTGPDGALWVVDMYRFVIEHPRWISPERLKTLNPRAGADQGRIYRLYPRGSVLKPMPNLTKLTEESLVKLMNSRHGALRDLVQRELEDRGETETEARRASVRPGLETKAASLKTTALLNLLARASALPAVRIQALSTLEGRRSLAPDVVLRALQDPDARVRRQALQRSETFFKAGANLPPAILSQLGSAMESATSDTDSRVRLQAALSLGEWKDCPPAALANLARTEDPWLRAAVLSSSRHQPGQILNRILADQKAGQGESSLIEPLIATAVGTGDPHHLASALEAIAHQAGGTGAGAASAATEVWRLKALASLLEALQRRGSSLTALANEGGPEIRPALEKTQATLAQAEKWAGDATGEESVRAASLEVLGRSGRQSALEVLGGVLAPGNSPELQMVAVENLARHADPAVGALLLGDWARHSPALRGRMVSVLASRESWTVQLLASLERGEVAGSEIPLPTRQQLLGSKNEAIKKRAKRLFGEGPSSQRADVLARYQTVPKLTGHPEMGGAVFEKNCVTCHAYRGRGNALGPNLAEFAGKAIEDFMVAILDPSAAINPNFLAYNVETKDGRDLTGLIRGETASSLVVAQPGGIQETLLRSAVQEIRASQVSLMPEGLEQAISPQDLADLVAWLKQNAPAPFGSATPEKTARARERLGQSGLNGLARVTFSSEQLTYPSWLGSLPLAHCRQTDGRSRVSWETEPAPAPFQPGEFYSFQLPAAMGFISQPSGAFALSLNGRPVLNFNVELNDHLWESADGRVRMTYTVKENDAEDSNGPLVLAVAGSLLEAGKPVRFEVTGSAANSQRWFGVYALPTRTTISAR
jgi:putative membrane-bound dehydrogenase-like protein